MLNKKNDTIRYDIWYDIWYDIIYLTAIGLTLGGSSTVHSDTQIIHRTAQHTCDMSQSTSCEQIDLRCEILGFHRDVLAIWALLGCYTACVGNFLSAFRGNQSVPSSGVKKSKLSWPSKVEPKGCPRTSARNYQHKLCNIPEELRSPFKSSDY